MSKINFKQVFESCKSEKDVKALWAELLTESVKAQNERVAAINSKQSKVAKDKAEEKVAKKAKAEKVEKKAVANEKKEDAKEKKVYSGIEAIKLTAAEKRAVESAGLKYVDYSERSFAITGETKTVKEILKKLSGKPNRNLSCGFGWVFAKVNEAAVLKSLNLKK